MPKTWQAVEKLYDSGKARAVGVSNFTTKKLADLLAIARVPPAINQVECHPGWQWRSQPENSSRADSYSKIFATNDSLHVLSKNGRTTNKNQDVTF